MTCRRGNSNKKLRGNSKQRRARRQWLVDTFGDGTTVLCQLRLTSHCRKKATVLTVDTVSVDCYPLARCDGGKYGRENIRPSCITCQCRQGGLLSAARRRARAAQRTAA